MSQRTYTTPPTARIVIYEGEANRIGNFVLDYPETETGGDLFGFWTHSGYPVVQFAIGPGPRSRRTTTSFYQDAEWLKDAGRELRRTHGLQHIGEWHSHHRLGLAQPSGGDDGTVWRAVRDRRLQQFSLVIATIPSAPPSVWLGGFLYRAAGRRDHCAWVILPGTSPVRTALGESVDAVVAPAAVGARICADPRATLEGSSHPGVVRPAFAPGSWITSTTGQAHARSLHEALRRVAGYVAMTCEDGLLVMDVGDPTFVRLVFPERFPREDVTPYEATHDGWRPLVGLPLLRDDPAAFIRAAREIHEIQRDDLVRDTAGDALGPCDQDAPAGALPRKTEDSDGLDP